MAANRLLRLPSVEAATGYKRSTLYRLVQQGSFPRPIALGPRASAWIDAEVQAWIEDRIKDSRKGGAK